MPAGLHVTHVIRSLEIGGMERLVHELVRHRPDSTSVICLDRKGHFAEQLEAAGYEVRVVGMHGGLVQHLWRLQREIARLGPDVVHCHNLLAMTHAGLLRSARCIPRLIATKHGSVVPTLGRSRHVSRWIAQRTRMVAVSHEVERIIRHWCRRTRFPVPVVPNGISAGAFSQARHRQRVRETLGYEPEHCVLGIVARLAAEKDHSTLLKAFQKLQPEHPQSRLAIIGDGPLRTDLEREATELGIADGVSFLGERHDVAELLSGLDVFVLSSRTEGLPMTILEAMSAGLPIVSTDVGGISTAVEDGRTGCLVPAGSPPALAVSLKNLIGDPETRRQMGQAGLRKLEQEFNIARTADRYEEIYHSI